jgi:phosphatidylglycerol:prolipoprotein diacylglycerol transferase
MFGCDYGKPIPSDAPGWLKSLGLRFPSWEVAFPETTKMFEQGTGCMTGVFQGAPAFHHHVSLGLVSASDAASALVYPTQILASMNGWLAFALVMLVRRKRRFRGQVFLVFTAYYGITRSLMEILRGDVGRGGIGALSTSQIVGIATFAASLAAWVMLKKRADRSSEEAMRL